MSEVTTLLTIDARGAEVGSASYVRALASAQSAFDRFLDKQDALNRAQTENSTIMMTASTSIGRLSRDWDRLTASVDPVFAATKKIESAFLLADRAANVLGKSGAEVDRVMGAVRLQHDAVAQAARRQADEYARLAVAGREAYAADQAQSRYAVQLGIRDTPTTSARVSASTFETELSRMEQIAGMRARQIGETFARNLDERLVSGASKSARDAGAVFAAEIERQDNFVRLRAQQDGANFAADLNARLGVGRGGRSARDSASAFEELLAERERGGGGRPRLSGIQMQGLSYQANDAVTMALLGASGQQIAFSQGGQVLQILQQGEGGVRGSLSAIKESATDATGAIAGMLGPLGLVAGGLAAAGVAAGAYYLLTREGDAARAERLERENELIGAVANKWGAATPALRDYNNELARRAELEGLKEATDVAAKRQFDQVRISYPDTQADYANAVSMIPQADEYRDRLNLLASDYRILTARIADSTVMGREARDVQRDLMGFYTATGIPALKEIADTYGVLGSQIDKAAAAAAKFRDDATGQRMREMLLLKPLNPLDGFNRTPFQTPDDMAADRWRREREAEDNRRLGALVPIPTARSNREDMLADQDKALDRQKSAYDRVTESARDRISQMQQEIALFGQYGARAEAARQETQMLNRALEEGKALSDPQRKAIHDLAVEYGNLAQAMKDAQFNADLKFDAAQMNRSPLEQSVAGRLRGTPYGLDSPQANTLREMDRVERMRSSGADFADRFADGLLNKGESIGEALGNALRESAADALQDSLSNLIDMGMRSLFKMPDLALPTTTASMTVTAASVTVNGGIGTGPLIGGAANDNITPATQGQFSPTALADRLPAAVTDAVGTTRGGIGLSGISTVGGLGAQVNSAYARNFQGLINDLEAAGYKITSLGGYNYRNIAGTNRLSNHAFGNAIDINPSANPMGRSLITDMPGNIREIAARNGLSWGGDWRSKKDAMHFEVPRGVTGGGGADALLGSARTASGALDKLASGSSAAATATADAASGLTAFGGGLGKMGNALGQFPAAPGAPAGGGGGGMFGWLGGLFGGGASLSPAAWNVVQSGGMTGLFDRGGFTGAGPADQVAGLAHKGEFYFSAQATKNLGLDYLHTLHEVGKRGSGFRDGGYAGPSVPRMQAPANQSREPRITVNNYGSAEVETRATRNEDGGLDIEILVDRAVAKKLADRGSKASRSLRDNFNVKRKVPSR